MSSRACITMLASGAASRIFRTTLCLFLLSLAGNRIPAAAQSLPATMVSATDSDSQMAILAQARISVETLFQQSVNFSCTERVTQSVLDRYDRSMYEEHSLFNYWFVADSGGKSLKFEESRKPIQAPFHDPGRTVLTTDGFGNMLLILHPAYAGSYKFHPDGNEVLEGLPTVKFRFESMLDTPSPLMLQVRGRNYSVALSGTVWIDSRNNTVVKLVVFNGSDMGDLGIKNFRSEIQYLPTKFGAPDESYSMPVLAVVDVETAKRHWRNIHRFTAYKRIQPALQATEAN